MRGVRTVLRGQDGYPASLARVSGAPESIRVRGELRERERRVAVVGTRHPDAYGLEMAARLAGDLARAGVSIVSGGAAGIDGAAHQAALEAGGHTVAVFGTGIDVFYPPAHAGLFERIVAAGGALVTEYPDGQQPTQYTFPQRNRIISGLSDAVLVVRAGRESGALITAQWAERQRIPVFAVPGNVGDPLAAGGLQLLLRGARAAVSAADILAPLGVQLSLDWASTAALAPADRNLSGPAARVFEVLSATPRHADEVARAAGLEAGPALAALLGLELQGLCEQRPGQYFVRRR